MASLEDLMARYQQADSAATADLVGRLSPQFFRFFLAQTRNRELAEDLLQDFWLRIHSARHTYRPGEPLLPWIYSIARRVRVDRYRKDFRVHQHELAMDTLPESASPSKNIASSIDLEAGLASLPAGQREVILLLKVAGLSLEEVARATRTTVGAVKQKAHRAYEKLRVTLGGFSDAV